jgi:hypothetical protein
VISGSAPARTPPAGAFHFTFFAPHEPVVLRFTRRRRLRRRKGQRSHALPCPGDGRELLVMREVMSRSHPAPTAQVLALALGAAALGVVAIGALAIGHVAIKKARFGALEVDELTVRRS